MHLSPTCYMYQRFFSGLIALWIQNLSTCHHKLHCCPIPHNHHFSGLVQLLPDWATHTPTPDNDNCVSIQIIKMVFLKYSVVWLTVVFKDSDVCFIQNYVFLCNFSSLHSLHSYSSHTALLFVLWIHWVHSSYNPLEKSDPLNGTLTPCIFSHLAISWGS